MKLMLAVLIIGTAIGLAYHDNKRNDKLATTLLITLIALTMTFVVFGYISSLGVYYPEYIYEVVDN